MANPQLYSQVLVTVNGKILAEEASVSLTQNSGGQPVFTMGHGYAGESPGAGTTEIDVDSAIPQAAFEYNPAADMFENQAVELGLFCAGQSLTAKGFIYNLVVKHSVNAEATVSFKFRSGPAFFE